MIDSPSINHYLMIVYIYTLTDVRTNEIRYVGKTINIEMRYRDHISKMDAHKTIKNSWLKNMRSAGYKPKMNVIEECNEDNWEAQEKYWIKYYRDAGCRLTNSTDGGENFNPSEEVRKKISLAGIGRFVSEETRKLKSRVGIGKKRINAKSQYCGVGFDNNRKLWMARITGNKRTTHLGYFTDEIMAALCYDYHIKDIPERVSTTNFPGHIFTQIEIDEFTTDRRGTTETKAKRSVSLQGKGIKSSTGYRGVSNVGNKFVARIMKDRTPIELGRFNHPATAAYAYNQKAIKLYGAQAILNDLWDCT